MSSFEKTLFIVGNSYWERMLSLYWRYIAKEDVLDLWKSRLYAENACAQQPSPPSPTGDRGGIAGVKVQNGIGLCQGGKSDTGKLYNAVCLYGSAHTQVYSRSPEPRKWLWFTWLHKCPSSLQLPAYLWVTEHASIRRKTACRPAFSVCTVFAGPFSKFKNS